MRLAIVLNGSANVIPLLMAILLQRFILNALDMMTCNMQTLLYLILALLFLIASMAYLT